MFVAIQMIRDIQRGRGSRQCHQIIHKGREELNQSVMWHEGELVEYWIEHRLLNWEAWVQIPPQPKILKWKMAELGPIQYFIWNAPLIWINAFSLINGHVIYNTWTEAWYLSKYCNPAIVKVDEMAKPDTSQANVNYYYHKKWAHQWTDTNGQCDAVWSH